VTHPIETIKGIFGRGEKRGLFFSKRIACNWDDWVGRLLTRRRRKRRDRQLSKKGR
jgi:hypothetical protein